MPKAILEFNLPEEQTEFTWANQARDVILALEEFRNELRSNRKHREFKTDEARALAHEVEQKFYSIMEEYNVKLD